jgi:hypothetical protein
MFTIIKLTGSQRPAGRMWEDDNPNRLIFLGSLGLGNEEDVLNYGDDPSATWRESSSVSAISAGGW